MNDRKDRTHKTLLERLGLASDFVLVFLLAPFGIANEIIAQVKSRLLGRRRPPTR